MTISIHALREEGDKKLYVKAGDFGKFLSTPSVRRATGSHLNSPSSDKISIHALREEGDNSLSTLWLRWTDFYPRPP